MDIRLYTGDCGAKTEQKIHAAIDSIVTTRVKNRAKFHDPTAPLSVFWLRISASKWRPTTYSTPNAQINGRRRVERYRRLMWWTVPAPDNELR